MVQAGGPGDPQPVGSPCRKSFQRVCTLRPFGGSPHLYSQHSEGRGGQILVSSSPDYRVSSRPTRITQRTPVSRPSADFGHWEAFEINQEKGPECSLSSTVSFCYTLAAVPKTIRISGKKLSVQIYYHD